MKTYKHVGLAEWHDLNAEWHGLSTIRLEDSSLKEFNSISVNEFLAAADKGVAINVWYDWFCDYSQLAKKTETMIPKIRKIANALTANGYDMDKYYVWMKNNCPMVGSLYDDIRIANIETRETLFVVVPKLPKQRATKGSAEVWHRHKDSIYFGTWQGTVEFLQDINEHLETA
mgnify:CR=1 FL=1|jgi:hypothetical protein